MDLREDHYQLLSTLIDDTEPLDQIVRMHDPPSDPRRTVDLLLELQSLGLVSAAVLVDFKNWRRPRTDDFERAIAEIERRVDMPVQSNLWYRLTESGQAEWRAKYGAREPSEMWRIAETDEVVEVNAVSPEVAAVAVANWQHRHPEIALEQIRTRTPVPFTLHDGTKVEPGVLITFRRRPIGDHRS